MNRALFEATFIANLGGLLFGFGIAMIYGAMPFLSSEFQLTTGMQGWAVNSTFIGCALGTFIMGRPSDFVGRRPLLMMVALLFLFSTIATGVINNFKVFLLFRFITGIAIGGSAVLSPVYISELSPPNLRGRLVASFSLAIVIGIILAFISDYMLIDTGANNWRFMFLAGALPALLFFLFLFLAPESPRYLMQRGLEHETDVVIRRVSPQIDKYGFMQEFKKSVNYKMIVTNANIFKKPFITSILFGGAMGMFSQFTGVNSVMYYTTDVFKSVGFISDSDMKQAMIIGIITVIFTIVAMTRIDKVGRKQLLLTGSIGMAVCLSVLAVFFMAGLQGSYLMLPVLVIFFGFFAASNGTVMWVLLSEMFSNNIRIRGAAIGLISFWVFNILNSIIFPFITSNHGIGALFIFYSVATVGSYFFFRKYMVETKGKTLEEMGNYMVKKEPVLP